MQRSIAKFCSNCDEITEFNHCSLCGSTKLIGLWRFLPDVKEGARLIANPERQIDFLDILFESGG